MLSDVIAGAESKVTNGLESVRRVIVLRITNSRTLSGANGQRLRQSVDAIIDQNIPSMSPLFSDDVRAAWNAGIDRASIGHPMPTTIMPEVSTSMETITRGFKRLGSSMSEEINNLLARATLSDFTTDDLLDRIGRTIDTGAFRGYVSKGNGIISYALEQIESVAFHLRAREIARLEARHAAQTSMARTIRQDKHPMTIKIWNHSHGGNPPRANHLAFDRHAVPIDMKFRLPGDDGETYIIEGPHDPTLPPGEYINCHCTTETTTLVVTDDDDKDIREKAEETGGYVDSRWE